MSTLRNQYQEILKKTFRQSEWNEINSTLLDYPYSVLLNPLGISMQRSIFDVPWEEDEPGEHSNNGEEGLLVVLYDTRPTYSALYQTHEVASDPRSKKRIQMLLDALVSNLVRKLVAILDEMTDSAVILRLLKSQILIEDDAGISMVYRCYTKDFSAGSIRNLIEAENAGLLRVPDISKFVNAQNELMFVHGRESSIVVTPRPQN